ncbi:MAG: TonB family protein [Myxococcales bacterium]|nr:TonB family protein [Myxococcales bacterium]
MPAPHVHLAGCPRHAARTRLARSDAARPTFRGSFRALAALFALTLWAGSAWAQTSPDIVPPKLSFDPGVVYPKQALADEVFGPVTVVVIVVIDKTGAVQDASVETPQGHGFDAAALEAARHLRFEPALRGGVKTASKIRFKYRFTAPAPSLEGALVEADSGAALGGVTVSVRTSDGVVHRATSGADGSFRFEGLARGKAQLSVEPPDRDAQDTVVELLPGKDTRVVFRFGASASKPITPETSTQKKAAPIEVVVRGKKLAPAVSSLTREEVRQIPGVFGDPFRAIEVLPGVTPIISGLPFFYIRGAPPGNVGYFLDGVRVPYLYHLAIGPSVVHPALVERVDLYPGGYPARFGRFAGGIVAAEATAPRSEWHGEGNIRLFDAGAMVEAPFAGGRGTALVGARYSYTAALLSLFAKEITLDYRDYQARVSYDITPKDRVTAFGFGSYDLLGRTQNGLFEVLFGTEFYRLDLRYDRLLPDGDIRTAVTLGYDQTKIGQQRNAIDEMLVVRSELKQRLEPGVTFRAGADTALDSYSATEQTYADPDDPGTKTFNDLFPPRSDLGIGMWSDVVLDVTPEVELTPGLRLDLYSSGGASAVGFDPRIAARFKLSDDFRIVHAYGVAHQPPSFVVPVPGLSPANLRGGLQSSYQTSAGVEWDLPDATTATATVFYNVFLDMTDTIGTSGGGGGGPPAFERRSTGAGYGFELFVKRKLTKRFGGFLSYTLSRSTRAIGREKIPATFDRTHVANVAVAYDLGRRWRAGTRFVFYTGTPKNPDSGGLVAPLRSSSPERNPAFYRIDLRLEKRWPLAKSAWISFVAEFMNATLHKEIFNDEEIGPIAIPSVGVEGGF